jgi:HSP20 family protein
MVMTMFFDPFREFSRVAGAVLGTMPGTTGMPVDLYLEGDHYVLKADLPGVRPDSIDVSVDGQVLTIRAERVEDVKEDVTWIANERPDLSLLRQFSVSDGVDGEHVSATYDSGVLTVVVPLAERTTSRKIQVGSAQTEQRSVEGGTKEQPAAEQQEQKAEPVPVHQEA